MLPYNTTNVFSRLLEPPAEPSWQAARTVTSSRIGVKIENGLPISVNVSLVQYAEARGMSSVWVSELRARDAFTTMAVYAAATERMTVGSSIVPIYTRSPVVLALTAASLADIAPGRIALGIGTSSSEVIEGWHGARRTRPLKAVEEHVRVLRSVLAGKNVEFDGEVVTVGGFRLEFPQLSDPKLPIYVAALGERMRALAASVADGVLLNVVPISYMSHVSKSARESALSAGRSPDALRLAGDLRIALSSPQASAEAARERQRKYLAHYGRVDVYNRFFASSGYPDEARLMSEAWERGDVGTAVASVSDAMLDDIVAAGEPDLVKERIRAFAESGVDEVILYPCWESGEDPVEATQRTIELAAEVLGT